MTSAVLGEVPRTEDGFRHEAFFYSGEHEFVAGTLAFLHDAVRAHQPAFVVVSARKIDLLRKELRRDAAKVDFADMTEVGLNPARIIPVWSDFVERHPGRRLRGVGEPIWRERSQDEIVECERHEALLNLAFAQTTGLALLCPYDIEALSVDVVDAACRNHPYVRRDGSPTASSDYLGTEQLAGPFTDPLPEPPASAIELRFGPGSLVGLRSLVWREAMTAGLDDDRAEAAVTALNEVASNTMRHAGGLGELRIWSAPGMLICEVSDHGHIDGPLVGRQRPTIDTRGGRGLWMVNQLCDLVQVRSLAAGTTVRIHLRSSPGRMLTSHDVRGSARPLLGIPARREKEGRSHDQ